MISESKNKGKFISTLVHMVQVFILLPRPLKIEKLSHLMKVKARLLFSANLSLSNCYLRIFITPKSQALSDSFIGLASAEPSSLILFNLSTTISETEKSIILLRQIIGFTIQEKISVQGSQKNRLRWRFRGNIKRTVM